MRIAITNSWPNLPESAEKEFLRRAAVAAKRISFEFCEVVTSDDIERLKPDVVIVSHEFTPKLTKYPTLGAMWSPSSLYFNDKKRLKSILSYDGYLVGSETVAQFIEDLAFSTSKKPILSDFLFLPSTYIISGLKQIQKTRQFSLFYAGVHWDGARHGDVFSILDEMKILNAYGPESSWHFLQNGYKGRIPFDGTSLFNLLERHGVALCLHKDAHRQFNTPSMRLFEAAASGSVIISDDFPFVRNYFGDSVLYLPKFDAGSKVIANQIATHMEWINTNPKHALQMAQASRAIFEDKLCLEKMLLKIPEFVDQVKVDMGLVIPKKQVAQKSVQYIVRIGSRPKEMIRRCLDSLANQTYHNIHLIIVAYKKIEDIDKLLLDFSSKFKSIKYIEVEDSGFRSSALWAGLNAVSCDYFAVQDDDDTLHPNHVQKCISTLAETASKFVYSGVIKHEETPNIYFNETNFSGSVGEIIKETRRLQFLDDFSQEKMIKFENYIQSNTWVASKDLLDPKILIDPKLVVAEDVYLYNLLMSKGNFVPIYSATAEWNWRSASDDNSMLGVPQSIWVESADRIRRRLSHLSFNSQLRFDDINSVPGDPNATEVVKRDIAPVKRFMNLNEMMPFNALVSDIVECNGISYPEESGSWSNAKTTTFTIPIKERFSNKPLFLVFGGHAAIYPQVQELVLTVLSMDMDILGTYQFTDSHDLHKVVEIPSALVETGYIRLLFKFSNTFNPRRAGVANDDRELAFLFQRLGLFESLAETGVLPDAVVGQTLSKDSCIQQLETGAYEFAFSKLGDGKMFDVGSIELLCQPEKTSKSNEINLVLKNVTYNSVFIGSLTFRLVKCESGFRVEFYQRENNSLNLIRWDKISSRIFDEKFIAYIIKISATKTEIFTSECNYRDVLWQRIQTLIFLNFSALLARSTYRGATLDSGTMSELIIMAEQVSIFAAETVGNLK